MRVEYLFPKTSPFRGNIGIFACACLPPIGGIETSALPFAIVTLSHHMSFTSKPCSTLTAAAAAYPKVFKGDFLQNGSSVPKGWYKYLDHFGQLLERICTKEELDGIEFEAIFEKNGALAMLMVGDVIPTRIETINAHAFSLGLQSSVSCRECGTMFEELPDAGNPYVCKQCQLSDSKHET